MAKSYEEYLELLNKLKRSYIEEEIYSILTKIIKGFESDVWKEMAFSNPYYKELTLEIIKEVIEDLSRIKESIQYEMSLLDKEIKSGGDINQLILLKVEWELLLIEVNYKLEELESI